MEKKFDTRKGEEMLSKLKQIREDFWSKNSFTETVVSDECKISMQSYDWLVKQAEKKEKYEQVINLFEECYRGSGLDLEAILDKYFYGGTSPVRDND